MIQGLVSRRRDLNAVDYLPLKLINGKKEEATAGAISFLLQGDLKARWRQTVLLRRGLRLH
jgi:hypothetical protein